MMRLLAILGVCGGISSAILLQYSYHVSFIDMAVTLIALTSLVLLITAAVSTFPDA
jgi:hypothetical protein